MPVCGIDLLDLDDFAAEQQLRLAQLHHRDRLVVMVDHDQRVVGSAHSAIKKEKYEQKRMCHTLWKQFHCNNVIYQKVFIYGIYKSNMMLEVIAMCDYIVNACEYVY